MGNDNILIVVVLAVIGYLFFYQKEGETTRGKTAPAGEEKITAGCPYGQSFYKGITEAIFGCPPGYESVGGFLGGFGGAGCGCSSAPTSIPDAANSPQTPAPNLQTSSPAPTKCPWDASMLIGDRRCGTQRIDYPTSPTDPGCVSGEYYLDIPTGVFQRCP